MRFDFVQMAVSMLVLVVNSFCLLIMLFTARFRTLDFVLVDLGMVVDLLSALYNFQAYFKYFGLSFTLFCNSLPSPYELAL